MTLDEFHETVLKEANKYDTSDLQRIIDVIYFARSKRIKLPLEHRKTLDMAFKLMSEIKRLSKLAITPTLGKHERFEVVYPKQPALYRNDIDDTGEF